MLVQRSRLTKILDTQASSWWTGKTYHHSISRSQRRSFFCVAGKSRRKAKRPGLFEVQVVTPPKESLGIHALPPDTHNGDQIQVAGKDFVVSGLVLQYKLVGGRYQRDHNRLDVQELSRYFLNLHLDSLMQKPASPQ